MNSFINLDRLDTFLGHLKAVLRVWRLPLVLLGFALFVAGAWWSFHDLADSQRSFHLGSLGILALLVVPSLAYGGVALKLLARSSGLSMPLGKGTLIAAYAYLAELLPIPGGAIVRTGALVGAGGSLQRSTALVLLTAILWISLAMIGAGLALLGLSIRLAWPLLLIGGALSLGITAWLWLTASPAIALQTLGHRIAGILLTGLRLQFAFAALGTSIHFTESMPFVLAMLAGSASSIAPAGLGVSESLAALAATVGSYPPGIAFLAVGLDRVLCLAGCAIVALGAEFMGRTRRAAACDALKPIEGDDR